MSEDSPIKTSIDKRLKDERYIIPKEKKEPRKYVDVQLIIIISVIIGLLLSLLQLLTYF